MATVNTIHDLFELLRDNPEWKNELRTIILTTELIDLPRKFDEFAKETRAHAAATDARFEQTWSRMDESDAKFDEFAKETRAHNAATDARFEETRSRMDESDAKFDEFAKETRAHNAATDARFEQTWFRMDESDAKFDEFAKETRSRMDESDAKFDEFAKETRSRMDESDAKFDEFVKEMRAHNAATDARFEETWSRMDESDAKFDEFAEETRTRLGASESAIKNLQDDVGELKGSNAMNVALRRPDLIAFALSEEMRYQKTLDASDLMNMIRARPGIVPQDVRMSFVEADLIIHATDDSGDDHYIAAEVSYTVGSGDADRAIRNADFLRRLTDKKSHAVVVGNDINGTASMIVEREGVFFYQLRRRDTRPR